jgi:hypothetical protein
MKGSQSTMNGIEAAVLSGLHAGACIQLGVRSHTVIGRDMACDVMLRDTSVAERHLMLVFQDGKICAVELEAVVEIDGIRLRQGQTVALRKGARIRLGEVLLGVGQIGTDWSQHEAFQQLSTVGRARRYTQRWLAHSARRRQYVRVGIVVLAGTCLLTSIVLPVYQWSQQRRLQVFSPDTMVRQLAERLRPLQMNDIHITLDPASGTPVLSGYVQSDEDLRRVEAVILTTSIRPFMRIFSSERMRSEAQQYLIRQLPDASARLTAKDTLHVAYAGPLRAQFKEWLRGEMQRDIPGLRELLFDGPTASAFAELAPAPFSIMASGPQGYLVDVDGVRFFPGAELDKGVHLRWVGEKTVSVERKESAH